MKKIRMFAAVMLLSVVFLLVTSCGSDEQADVQSGAEETESTEAAVEESQEEEPVSDTAQDEKTETEGAAGEVKSFAGIWKYDESAIYIEIGEDLKWKACNLYGQTIDSGSAEVEGDSITLTFESDGGTDSYKLTEDGKLADVQGSTLSKVEEMVFLPSKDDELTQTANFPGKFESITINYPEKMIYKARTDVANALDFGAKNGKGTDDYYSNIVVMFQPITDYDKFLQSGSALAKHCMGFMLDNCFNQYYSKFLIKSLGTNFQDKGSYYSITGYMWLDGSIFTEDISEPVRGVMEIRYYGPTGYVLLATTIAPQSRIENYSAIASKMMDTCSYKTDWITSPKTVPKQPGKKKSAKQSDSGDYGTPYYWTDSDGDVWYWNGQENQFISFGDDGYVDNDGSYYESNDAGWDTDDSYYDDYDPYADWSDAGDNYSDWSDPGDYGDYEDYEDYSDYGDYGDYIDW